MRLLGREVHSAASVEGLIKWIKGDEWRNDFEEVFDRHVGRACRGAGVELEELADIIGDHGMFVSSGSGERNVADEYLKRRGWKESAGARAYIRALRTSVMSLYEVSDVVVGESFLARDLVRGGAPVRVFERSATRSLSQWDRIAGLARAPLVERQSIEQMMASSREHSDQDVVRLPPDEERSIVHQALRDHYRNTLDEPIPALGHQTPRKAVKTAKGRKKVIAWHRLRLRARRAFVISLFVLLSARTAPSCMISNSAALRTSIATKSWASAPRNTVQLVQRRRLRDLNQSL